MSSPSSSATIFDFDGVLADTSEAAYGAIEVVAARKRVMPPTHEYLRNHTTQEIMQALRIRWFELPYYVSLGRRLLAQSRKKIALFPHASEVISNARQSANYVFIVSSNSSKLIHSLLDSRSLLEQVDEIHGGVGLFGKKRVLKRLISRFKLDPTRVCYVGDETRDIEAARKVGIRSIGVSWGYQSLELLAQLDPDFLADSPLKLSQTIRQVTTPVE